jgi:3-deoxy-D-manno-octulosonic-acid transferase
MTWMETAYRGFGRAATASGLVRWVLRDRPRELAERLGEAPECRGAVWLHAASVGELAAAGPLIRRLREAGVTPLVLSVMTRTGLDAARDLPLDAPPFHPPLDAPGPVERALARMRPSAWIALETELWPILLRGLAQGGVPAAVVSARLTERGAARMRRAASLYRQVLESLGAVGARTEGDARRFAALGVPAERLRVTGDLKEDTPPPERTPPPDTVRWAAACTRPGEEQDVLAALGRLEACVPEGELVLAPRHPERFEEVARLVERSGHALARWSRRPANGRAPTTPSGGRGGWSVLLVDEMGVLDEVYRDTVCAFVGGSLRPFRGHSPWEAARAGRPVVMGPDTANCAEAFRALEAAGGAVRAGTPDELADRVAAWLTDRPAAERAGRAAYEVARGAAGGGERTVAFLRERGVLP